MSAFSASLSLRRFTTRWQRALPSDMLSPALKAHLGGEKRRRSTITEQLQLSAEVLASFVPSQPHRSLAGSEAVESPKDSDDGSLGSE